MTVFIFFLGLFQCAFLLLLGRAGAYLGHRTAQEQELAQLTPPAGWPPCALIVPCAGAHPIMEAALRTLAEQNYPDYHLYLVTANVDDPAALLISRLRGEYGHITHVVAGFAQTGGQKNYNHLQALQYIEKEHACLAFGDSTHLAGPDFLRCLIGPIARGEAAFTTGYHTVAPQDSALATLGYTINVLFMRFLQALPNLTQPWGGAMAVSREAFERYQIAKLWQDNVVDDCSLAALLERAGIRARLCPGALLGTIAIQHSFTVWRAWLERQVLFLKFCLPGQWLALGLVCLLMTLPPAWCILTLLRGILGLGDNMAPFLALLWLGSIWYVLSGWRRFLPQKPAISRWILAFFCSVFLFAAVYGGTIFQRALLWHNILYRVGKGGKVLNLERQGGY